MKSWFTQFFTKYFVKTLRQQSHKIQGTLSHGIMRLWESRRDELIWRVFFWVKIHKIHARWDIFPPSIGGALKSISLLLALIYVGGGLWTHPHYIENINLKNIDLLTNNPSKFWCPKSKNSENFEILKKFSNVKSL